MRAKKEVAAASMTMRRRCARHSGAENKSTQARRCARGAARRFPRLPRDQVELRETIPPAPRKSTWHPCRCDISHKLHKRSAIVEDNTESQHCRIWYTVSNVTAQGTRGGLLNRQRQYLTSTFIRVRSSPERSGRTGSSSRTNPPCQALPCRTSACLPRRHGLACD